MTKRHFIELANVLRRTMPDAIQTINSYAVHTAKLAQWERDRDALADFCARQNPRFARERWLAYIAGECGPNGGKVATK